MSGSNWTAKGGALSDKSAREEYGLTQAEIRSTIAVHQFISHQSRRA